MLPDEVVRSIKEIYVSAIWHGCKRSLRPVTEMTEGTLAGCEGIVCSRGRDCVKPVSLYVIETVVTVYISDQLAVLSAAQFYNCSGDRQVVRVGYAAADLRVGGGGR